MSIHENTPASIKEFNILESASREEAALASILNDEVGMALHIIAEMPLEQQYALRKAAETLTALCKKP